MQAEEQEYRQSKNAIYISYVIYRGYLAACTGGYFALVDWLNYRNTKLIFEDNFLTFVTGAFVTHSKEIPYEDIKNVKVDQSIIGSWANYGTVNITMKDGGDTISFKYVHDPEKVRKAAQSKFVSSTKLKMI